MPTSSDSADPSTSASQSDRCYHETVTFEVDGVVYRVLKHGLVECSSVFRDMFSLPQGMDQDGAQSIREGDTDENPIRLVGCTNEEFKALVLVMYPLLGEIPELTKEQWRGVLRLARLWDMARVSELAIGKLNKFNLQPVEKIKLGKEHGVPQWLMEGYESLVEDLSQISLSEMESLGSDTAFRILWSRDQLARSQSVLPKPGGYWVGQESILCGNCSYNDRTRALSDLTQACSICAEVARNSRHGITIVDVSSLLSTTAQAVVDANAKTVKGKVAEVFKEELEDAKRRNSSALT